MFLNPTLVTEIRKIISKMLPKNSTGIYEIPISVVKLSFDHKLFGLCHILNLSLSQGQFITDFKKVKVIPVHKKEQKTNVNNYQFVVITCLFDFALLCVDCKLFGFIFNLTISISHT